MRRALSIFLLLGGCVTLIAQPLVPTDETFIGTWKWVGLPGHLGTLHFEFRPDHTFECTQHAGDKPVVTSFGTWRVEYCDFILEEQRLSQNGVGPPAPPRTSRQTLRESSRDRLTFTFGGCLERVKD